MKNNIIIINSVEQILGLNEEVTAIELAVQMDNSISIKSNSNIIISIDITFSTMENSISIVQQLNSNNIIVSNNNSILPIEGQLWIIGKKDEINIISSNTKIFYISNN